MSYTSLPVDLQSLESYEISDKLWIYTNFDCNLRCSYCVAESSPWAERRALGLETLKRLVKEAVTLGFREIFLTGGEPFIKEDIYDMIAYASQHLPTTVLTNGMLLKGRRLAALQAVANHNLKVQISLDGGIPQDHDAYRGAGTWSKTVSAIQRLRQAGFSVRISTTETPANQAHMDRLQALRASLGIAQEDHFIRPLAQRGFSQEGIQVGPNSLAPELTVTRDGIYWHPLISPASVDMQIARSIFPLADALQRFEEQLQLLAQTGQVSLQEFT